MSQSTSNEELSSEEQLKKNTRRNSDNSIGVTTRSRHREQEKKVKDFESTSNQEVMSNTNSPVEQCAICMESFTNQEVGKPENCEHSFCLNCLIEWAKKNNSCPIDRIGFRRIFKRHLFTDKIPYDSMKVKDTRLEIQLEDDFLEMIDDDISCRVCGRDDQEDVLLICDECGNGYHTFCLELPGVPDTPEWMCPLCEVDRISAAEDLYDDSDLEEIQHILFDDTLQTIETDNEANVTVRPTRNRQNERTNLRRNRRTRSRRRQQTRRRATATRRPTLVDQQRQRHRRQRRIRNNINRRIENVNVMTRDGSTSGFSRAVTVPNEAPRLSIYDGEPVPMEDESTSTTSTSSRSVITPSEAARRIAASGIPILSRSETEPSISRELSLRRLTATLDREPSRTIRPPPTEPRIPINQLPRIRRRADAPTRAQSTTAATTTTRATPAVTNSQSFIDNLLNSQERLHNLQNIRMHGPHIEIS